MNLALSRQNSATDTAACPIYFDPEMVTTRDRQGNPLSRYRDDVWDYSASTRQKSKRLYHLTEFTETSKGNISSRDGALASLVMAQAKALLWTYICLKNKAPSFGMIYSVNVTLKKWAVRAVAEGLSLFQLLENAELVLAKIDAENAGELSTTSVLLKALYKNRVVYGISFDLDKIQKDLYRLRIDSPGSQQTPLIPAHIYSSILASLISNLEEIESSLERLLAAFAQSRNATSEIPEELAGSARGRYRKGLLESVFDYAHELGKEPGSGTVHNFLCSRILDCQTTLIALCVAFTGMRLGEALNLPRDSLVSFEHGGKRHWLVRGFTYKLENGEMRETSWVTNEIGRRALSAAQKISAAIGAKAAVESREAEYPLLFCGTPSEYSRLSNRWKDKWTELVENVCPVVSEADMSELERMQLGRDWELTGIQVGLRWPMRAHQFRRALAVYAQIGRAHV